MTARQGRELCHAEGYGIVLVVHKLNRYDVKAAALQETLWFESNVGESLMLASGRPVPADVKRGEGVAIVLSGGTSVESRSRALEVVES